MSSNLRMAFILILAQPGVLLCQSGQSSSDSLVDVFPLSQGNEWTYRYFTDSGVWPSGNPGQSSTDSGVVTYRVAGRIGTTDSTRWQLEAVRHLMRHQISWQESLDTTFPVSDTSITELIEWNQGQHQVYRPGDPNAIRFDVFPFTQEFVDTTPVYRYRGVGAGDTTVFLSCVEASPGPAFRSTFTFKRGVGLVRTRFNSGTVDAWATTEHFLLSSTITSAPGPQAAQPSSIHLYQNYPNPFNPLTTIRYSIRVRSNVSLTVYNMLGQKVRTLVQDEEDAGTYSVRFDATGLASGMYTYAIKAGSFVYAKKLLLIR